MGIPLLFYIAVVVVVFIKFYYFCTYVYIYSSIIIYDNTLVHTISNKISGFRHSNCYTFTSIANKNAAQNLEMSCNTNNSNQIRTYKYHPTFIRFPFLIQRTKSCGRIRFLNKKETLWRCQLQAQGRHYFDQNEFCHVGSKCREHLHSSHSPCDFNLSHMTGHLFKDYRCYCFIVTSNNT